MSIKNQSQNAAMYVRMSTDHQRYSTENQEVAIREYAEKHDLEIVQIFADEGKSGLNLAGRKALQQLIEVVQLKDCPFKTILVLDVTRWGRFQDADESAYYEYICRSHGIDVQYVAEQFQNDGSPVSNIVKSVKRSMAGEYSRELSGKVFAGQCRLIEKGFRQGGMAGFGLRRMLMDEQGNSKGLLSHGEHKSLQTDRVILVPGPEEEQQTVRWIYRTFIEDGKKEADIAATLNHKGILTDLGRKWTRATIYQILTNEKYIGNNVYNRVSNKLKKRRVINAPDMWVRADGVYDPIIEISDFYTVQGIMRQRNRRYSDDEMLCKLKALYSHKGWLSGIVIDEQEDMPSSTAYSHRFGSLIRAYSLVGYTPDRDFRYLEINRYLREFHSDMIERTMETISQLGGTLEVMDDQRMLRLNEELNLSIIMCRCHVLRSGIKRWKLRFDRGLTPDITLAIRMDQHNKKIHDYYLLPMLDIGPNSLLLSQQNGLGLDGYRFDDMEDFFSMTKRIAFKEAI